MNFRDILKRGAGRVVQEGESVTEAGVNTAKAVAKEAVKDIAKQAAKRVAASLAAAAAPYAVPILVVVLPLVIILVLMLAVGSGTAGQLTGVNNPREPGQTTEGPPGDPRDIPPATGDCAGIANTARAEIGVVEVTENDSPRIREYRNGGPPEPWCSDFVSWVLWQSGNRLSPSGTSENYGPTDPSAGLEPSVRNMQAYFNRYEIVLPPGSAVQAGDVVFYDWRRCGGEGNTHNGIVVSYDPNSRTYVSVEGNIGIGGGQEGVGARTRSVSSSCITGFGRLRNCQSAAAILDDFKIRVTRRK